MRLSNSILQGRGRSMSVPPQWVWEGFAQFAPEAAELACQGLDLAAAERYFDVRHFSPTSPWLARTRSCQPGQQ